MLQCDFVPPHRAIDQFLEHEIAVGSFPGAVYAVGSARGIEWGNALGWAVAVPLRIPAALDTIYDCASITKPLITTALVLQAVSEGRIALDDEFEGFRYRDLLTHTSGLRAWLPLYASIRDSVVGIRDSYLEAMLRNGPDYDPHTRVVYSDLNFVMLWCALQSIYGDYVAAANERVFARLALDDAMFRPAADLRPWIAATEWSQRWERGMCADRSVVFNGFREGLIWGETHDGNSFYAGGTAGNAGLFATARAVYRIAQGWLDGTLVPRELLEQAAHNYTPGLEENRGLGWLLSYPGHNATGMLSPRAFGHTGFTGTSVWIDPDADRVMVLLTNRVHPCANAIAMQKIRGEFHRLALAGSS
ncbi:MAG TPA: serine hydrolase domain-containing protein [Thermoanaerobaculia bacterium]